MGLIKSSSKIAIILLLVLMYLLSMNIPAIESSDKAQEIEEQIRRQEEEYDKLQKQIKNTNKKISETNKKEKHVTQQIEVLSQRITLTQQRVNVVNLKVVRVQNNISKLTRDIYTREQEIEKIKVLLRERLITIYKFGGITEFNLLLSSNSALDVLNNSYLLSKIAKEDQRLISTLDDEVNTLTKIHNKLKSEKGKYEEHREELKEKGKELKNVAEERNQILRRVRQEKEEYLAQQREFLKASKELQAKVRMLIDQKRRLNAQKNKGQPQVVYYKGGRLQWPAQGRITSTFGTRIHPVFKTKTTHTGLDIAAPHGTPVYAANAGEVLYTGWMRGYGQVIIIDHGGDLTTVYAHLSKIVCRDEQKIRRGEIIGNIGSTGVATGNHLHFEVRVNGNAVNPMGYLR
ncbi:MAG: peptidoglycan DD-metalloendopeptidase family protein [Synergistaceae bacterium]